MTAKRGLLRIALPVVLGLLLIVGFLITPRQPLADVTEYEHLRVSRGTSSAHGDTAGGPADRNGSVRDVTDRIDPALLKANLRLLRTDRLPKLNSLFGTGSWSVSEIEYDVTGICADGSSFHLTVGSSGGGRFQEDGNAVYSIRDSAAWFELLEAMAAEG